MTTSRLRPFGTTIFTEMSALAERTGALNLGQGFPDEDGPEELMEAVTEAMHAGANQYAPLPGVPRLRQAIATHQRRAYELRVDPDTQVQVTFGATEAIAAALLGICERGDEVVTFEPYYDQYAAVIALAGAKRRAVTLRPPGFALDVDALAAAIGPRARVLLFNSPHNPTGKVFSLGELEAIAELCVEHDLIAITDEVYEHLVFDGKHVPLATLPGMDTRTITISSLGKSFSLTGWKVGWATGPAELIAAVRAAKQYLSFAGGTPMQHAAAHALEHCGSFHRELRKELRAKRNVLCKGLAAVGPGGAATRRHLLRQRRRRVDRRARRRAVLPRPARARGRGRDPDVGLLRRQGRRQDARALRVLQAPRRAGRRGRAARSAGRGVAPPAQAEMTPCELGLQPRWGSNTTP